MENKNQNLKIEYIITYEQIENISELYGYSVDYLVENEWRICELLDEILDDF